MPRCVRLFFVSFVCFVGAAFARASDVEFLRVWASWRDAESFDRISEYFGRGENTGRQIVLRTQPNDRAGYYFLVRIKSKVRFEAAKFEVTVIRPDNPEPKTHTFAAPAISLKETVFQLGLTGADWPGGQIANPVAWKLTLVDAEGRVLGEHKSFLWEKPPK